MKLCELKEVLSGDVHIYEGNPDFHEAEGADSDTQTKNQYRDLYTGNWSTIPEGLLQREIFLVFGGTRMTRMVAYIQLEKEPGEGGAA